MSSDLPLCPSCNSKQIVKNGKIHNGKQNYKCRKCDRQFVENPQNKIITTFAKSALRQKCLTIVETFTNYPKTRKVGEGVCVGNTELTIAT